MATKCARAKRAAARQPDAHFPGTSPCIREGWQFPLARSVSISLYPEGTVSRIEAAILFADICNTRKMQSLRWDRLASALQPEKVSLKSKSQGLNSEADSLDEQRIENR